MEFVEPVFFSITWLALSGIYTSSSSLAFIPVS